MAVALLAFPVHAQTAAPVLHPMFADHAVLQRDQPIRIYGAAGEGAEVTVTLGRATVTTRAGADHRWTAILPPMQAGGPYTLTARINDVVSETRNDVMVGDVFLCSGQSNMEMAVRGTLGAANEIANSANPNIRMLTVPQLTDPVPLESFRRPVEWQVAGPETVGAWSATCFYMARELAKAVQTPIGLVSASWGGANIRAWIGEAGAEQIGGYAPILAMLRAYRTDPAAAQAAFGARWEEWWRARSGDRVGAEPWARRSVRDWRRAPEGLGDYRQWDDPAVSGHTGMVWFRTSLRLTAAQAAQAATLELSSIDEVDQTWVNGRAIGNTFGYGTPRTYQVPAGVLRAGENTVVVNALNTWASGGLTGDHSLRMIRFADGTNAPLQGEWRYAPAPASYGTPPRTPWESVGGLTTMYNGMIEPIGRYNFRGAVWYQGESNTGEPDEYQVLMATLMSDWRARFQAPELPFLIVQLPNYGGPHTAPIESGWAGVREAQRRAVAADAHAGLVVTIDAGDPRDLHPANKQEIGRRLARAARHVVYGEAIAPSGPAFASVRREGGQVLVSFSDVNGELVAYSGLGPIGFELCGAEQASCRFVGARASGSVVMLTDTNAGSATRVRFCWADSPVCTLYDQSGAIAGPFEAAIP